MPQFYFVVFDGRNTQTKNEGLDLPEVSLVAIFDADKEGFLRSPRSLIQTMGRAARNVRKEVLATSDGSCSTMPRAEADPWPLPRKCTLA